MCLAAQFVTMSSYSPIDLSSYLTGHCWHDRDEEVLICQYEALKKAMESWDARDVSLRTVVDHTTMEDGNFGYLCFHDCKYMGMLASSLCAFSIQSSIQKEESKRTKFMNLAEEVEALIEKHLKREIQEYKLLVDKIISSSNDKERGITVKELLKLTAVMKCTIEEICSGFKCFLDIQDNDDW